MSKNTKNIGINEPLRHACHKRPVTRREFISQGFMTGAATVTGGSIFSMFANPKNAQATLAPDISALKASCGLGTQGAGKIPFICFDLAGGANIAGSNVLIGGPNGQMDFLTSAGYSKLGLPGDIIPSVVNPVTGTNDFINSEFGLAFHSDSAFLRGMLEKVSVGNRAQINGAAIPARSANDTGNNPHNPMYGINKAGANGSLLTLIGSQATDSGGNSMSPANMIDTSVRPTKVDRGSDVTGLVDIGDLVGLLSQDEAVLVMEAMERISEQKLGQVHTQISNDAVIKEMVKCGYVKSADLADRFGDPTTLNPALDPDIVGASGIFTADEYDGEGEFRKTSAVMKLVMNGFAGAGTITMGGFDYHTGDRSTGEARDLRVGRSIGACLEYAAKLNTPVMIYVFSDGSVSSNGTLDNSAEGRGKGVWSNDNSSTASSFFMVYNPPGNTFFSGRPQLIGANVDDQAKHQQIGYMRSDASVETASSPAANNVNLLVETVILNYMALHGDENNFATVFPAHGLGNVTLRDSISSFEPIVNGIIGA